MADINEGDKFKNAFLEGYTFNPHLCTMTDSGVKFVEMDTKKKTIKILHKNIAEAGYEIIDE